MRQWASPKLRIGAIVVSSIAIVLGVASIGLAFSAQGPTRTLRPILSYADSAYLPLYIGMAAAGLLIATCLAAILSVLYGNRGVDLAVCITLLVAVGLSLAALGLAGSIKGGAQTDLEATLTQALKRYGRDDSATFEAWNMMQTEYRCCAVRTNRAQPAYEETPWFQEMRKGNPHTVPKIPDTCCTKAAQANPKQKTDCTFNNAALPSQNPYMNPIGCFEAMSAVLDTYSSRFIIVGLLSFLGSASALGVLGYALALSARQGGGGSSRASKPGSQKFGNSMAGSIAGTASVIGGPKGQPLISRPVGTGSSVYGSRHSLFSEPPPVARAPSESSLPSVAARSLFSEPPVRVPPSAIQAQPMRPRQQHQQQQQQQQHQQPPVPKPRSSHAGSIAAPSEASLGDISGGVSQQPSPQPPKNQKQQPPPQPQALQAQPMKKPQQQQQPQAPILLTAQRLRPQQQQQQQRKRQSNF